MAKIISESDLEELIRVLAGEEIVFAPQKNKESVFAKVTADSVFNLNYATTILPPKEMLLPPMEVLLEYENGDAKQPKAEKMIIFGLSLEDLEGINLLDAVFSKPTADLPYILRREKTILVGCDRFSPPKGLSYDLYLMRLAGDRFAAYAGTKEGQKILKNQLFKNQNINIPSVKRKPDELLLNPDVYRAVEKSPNHPVWGELAEICFGCGICSFVCPLCYCFDAQDTNDLGKEKGRRCRQWDSCMLPHFAETNEENFRKELTNRIYNWYFHKFVRMPAEYGTPGCVGCNRCTIYCPAKINYREVLRRVLSDYSERRGK